MAFQAAGGFGIKLSRKMKYSPLVSQKQGALYFGTGFSCFVYDFQTQSSRAVFVTVGLGWREE